MQHIQGIFRHQLQVVSLEDTISQDNPVRFIDAFVHSINLPRIGFREQVLKTEGRPSFDTKVFLKTHTKITWQDSIFGLVSLSF